jgi:hypothetical protein
MNLITEQIFQTANTPLTANTFVCANRMVAVLNFSVANRTFQQFFVALVDADYKFIAIEVAAYGLSSDSNIFKQSNLHKSLERNELNIPKGGPSPQDENGEHMPFVIVGDEAFALSEYILRPYPHRNLSIAKRIFN